jgi:hypothetical protein
MALIEVYHVVASNLPIDPDVTTDIPQGSIIGLNHDANVVFADAAAAVNVLPIGIAGDSRSTGTSYTPESGSSLTRVPAVQTDGALIMGAYGAASRRTQNRVADQGNEVLASCKMTCYHSGGEFWTDQYELVQANAHDLCEYVPGELLYCSASDETVGAEEAAAGETAARAGRFTDNPVTNFIVGMTVQTPTAYPSGVPGTDVGFTALPEGGNSLSYGTFLHAKLTL